MLLRRFPTSEKIGTSTFTGITYTLREESRSPLPRPTWRIRPQALSIRWRQRHSDRKHGGVKTCPLVAPGTRSWCKWVHTLESGTTLLFQREIELAMALSKMRWTGERNNHPGSVAEESSQGIEKGGRSIVKQYCTAYCKLITESSVFIVYTNNDRSARKQSKARTKCTRTTVSLCRNNQFPHVAGGSVGCQPHKARGASQKVYPSNAS